MKSVKTLSSLQLSRTLSLSSLQVSRTLSLSSLQVSRTLSSLQVSRTLSSLQVSRTTLTPPLCDDPYLELCTNTLINNCTVIGLKGRQKFSLRRRERIR